MGAWCSSGGRRIFRRTRSIRRSCFRSGPREPAAASSWSTRTCPKRILPASARAGRSFIGTRGAGTSIAPLSRLRLRQAVRRPRIVPPRLLGMIRILGVEIIGMKLISQVFQTRRQHDLSGFLVYILADGPADGSTPVACVAFDAEANVLRPALLVANADAGDYGLTVLLDVFASLRLSDFDQAGVIGGVR